MNKIALLLVILLINLFSGSGQIIPETRFIDATNGNDLADGTTPQSA